MFDSYKDHGWTFHFGSCDTKDRTDAWVLLQCKTYVGAVHIADDIACHEIGVQYRQGL